MGWECWSDRRRSRSFSGAACDPTPTRWSRCCARHESECNRSGRRYRVINKIVSSAAEAVADVKDGATIMIGGFGTAGMPSELVDALIELGPRNLTIVANNAGNGEMGLALLLKAKQVRKIIC